MGEPGAGMMHVAAGPDGVVRVTLQRPDRRNAIDEAAMSSLADVAEQLGRPGEARRAVLLRADGPHFSAGGDLGGGSGLGAESGDVADRILEGPQRVARSWWEVALPVVAAVRGHAAGLGACLALTADVVIVSETARFRFPFCRRGFTPDSGASWLLPRLIGLPAATAAVLLDEPIDAERAYALGLVHRVVADADLDAAAEAVVTQVAGGATAALIEAKRLLRAALDQPLVSALSHEAAAFQRVATTSDFGEGIAAFFERRAPEFRGE